MEWGVPIVYHTAFARKLGGATGLNRIVKER